MAQLTIRKQNGARAHADMQFQRVAYLSLHLDPRGKNNDDIGKYQRSSRKDRDFNAFVRALAFNTRPDIRLKFED